jgi:ArsR family transcriptional regulator, arsenate/arsenite/antimonite-responsive transcriptional repressor
MMSTSDAELFLKAIADELRLQILEFIKKAPRTSNDIQDALKKSQSTISQHLKVLVDEEILTYKRDGAKKTYEINNPIVLSILSNVNAFLIQRHQRKVAKLEDDAISDTLRV